MRESLIKNTPSPEEQKCVRLCCDCMHSFMFILAENNLGLTHFVQTTAPSM